MFNSCKQRNTITQPCGCECTAYSDTVSFICSVCTQICILEINTMKILKLLFENIIPKQKCLMVRKSKYCCNKNFSVVKIFEKVERIYEIINCLLVDKKCPLTTYESSLKLYSGRL